MAQMRMSKQKVFSAAELDEHDHIRPAALLDLFQQLAGEHAETLGVGFDALYRQGRLWVVSRIKAVIENKPALYETVTAETWPEPTGRVDFDRDYLVRGEDGRIIAKGVSKWCVIDLNSRKLVRAQDIVFPGEFCLEKTFEPPFAKLLPAETLPLAFEHTVRRSDLDHNGHMNNARYGELLLDAVPTDRIIRAFQIDFLHEAMRGETIAVHALQNENALSVCGSIEHKPCFCAHAETTAFSLF